MCKHDYLGQFTGKIRFGSEAPNDSLLRAVHSLYLVPFKSKALLSSQVVSRLIAIYFISESFAKGCDMGFLTMRFKAHVGRDFSAKFKQRFRVFFLLRLHRTKSFPSKIELSFYGVMTTHRKKKTCIISTTRLLSNL